MYPVPTGRWKTASPGGERPRWTGHSCNTPNIMWSALPYMADGGVGPASVKRCGRRGGVWHPSGHPHHVVWIRQASRTGKDRGTSNIELHLEASPPRCGLARSRGRTAVSLHGPRRAGRRWSNSARAATSECSSCLVPRQVPVRWLMSLCVAPSRRLACDGRVGPSGNCRPRRSPICGEYVRRIRPVAVAFTLRCDRAGPQH